MRVRWHLAALADNFEGDIMSKNSFRNSITALIAVAALLVLCVGCAADTGKAKAPEAQEGQSLITTVTPDQSVGYSLYYGLIDKDTGEQEKSTEEYRQAIADLFVEAGIGFTVYEAEGAFPREDGTVAENVTLVFTGVHGTEEAIQDLITKTQQELNLESVYCETALHGYGIYGGVVNELE